MFNMPTIDLVATGRKISALRSDAGLSVRDLQDIFGFATPQAIYKWQHVTALDKYNQFLDEESRKNLCSFLEKIGE